MDMPQYPSIISVGHIRIDPLHGEVSVAGKVTPRLTPVEIKVLYFLAVNANKVCSTSQITSHVWGFHNNGDVHLAKAYIRHIRFKIEPNPNEPIYILTIPDVGYKLVVEEHS